MVNMSDSDSDSRSKEAAKKGGKLKRERQQDSSSSDSDSGSDSSASSKSSNNSASSSSSSSSSSSDAKPPSSKAAKRSHKEVDDDDKPETKEEEKQKEESEKESSDDDDDKSKEGNEEEEESKGDDDDEESGGDIGPMPMQKKKKKKVVIPFEKIYLDNLPKAEAYERSFMHRDSVKFVLVAQKTHFIITASVDGHIKFWVKKAIGIEFVKHFRAHLGLIVDMSVNNPLGTLLATVADDHSLKVFDIVNFDMINMFKLDYLPGCVEWAYSTLASVSARHKDPFPVVAVSDSASNRIFTYEGTGSNLEPLKVLDRIHTAPVARMRFNALFSTMVSVDEKGMLDYWGSHRAEYRFPGPDVVAFASKLDTDLYELAKAKVRPHDIAFSPNGTHFAMICSDRKVRLYRFTTGKLIRVYDESLAQLTALQQATPQLPNMEFGRRMAAERDLEKVEHMFRSERILFDDSGHFLVYPTMLGIKIINWASNKLVKMLGKGENFRPIALALHQTIPDLKTVKSTVTPEMAASSNPSLEAAGQADPTLFATGFRKNRFYLFSRREPDDSAIGEANADGTGLLTGLERDVFNEKPSREDMVAASEGHGHGSSGTSGSGGGSGGAHKLAETACLHTTLGDITLKLFAKECPRTVENFVTHCRNGYYNGHIFHRVIRQFMIQTGDPTGTGTGGQSIWGGEFEDELVAELKHDRPFTVSMANAGKNTNGSQFFITVIPTPWLDGKHTVFGRVSKGMDVVQAISQVRTHPKTSKPYDDIKILNIQVK